MRQCTQNPILITNKEDQKVHAYGFTNTLQTVSALRCFSEVFVFIMRTDAPVRPVPSFSLRLTSTATKKLKNYYCSSQIQATGQHHLVCSSSLTDVLYPFRCSKPFPSAEKAILIESDNSFACCDEMQQLAFCGSSSSAIHCALISVHTYLTNYHRIALLNSLLAKSSVDTTCL